MNLIHMSEENDYHNGCLDINISKWKNVFCEEKVILMHDLKNHINEKVLSIGKFVQVKGNA